MGLIQRFNREQTISGSLFIGAGLLVLGVLWVVLRCVFGAANFMTSHLDSSVPKFVNFVVTGLFIYGAWRWLRTGERYRVFKDELLHRCIRQEQGLEAGPVAAGDGDEEVTGITELLAQVLLSAPRLIFTGAARVLSRLPQHPDLEERMRVLLERLRVLVKWQPAMAYVDQAEELGALVRCGLVEFSASKMLVKAAATETVAPEPTPSPFAEPPPPVAPPPILGVPPPTTNQVVKPPPKMMPQSLSLPPTPPPE